MEFVIATNNRGKLEEFARMLTPLGHTVKSLADLDLDVHPPERGETYAEIALGKAKMVAELCGLPTLGDDSGLEVDALGGEPGVRTARFAGPQATDEENNRKLLKLLERYPYARRGARFVCALALMMPDGRALQAEGVCKGMIGLVPSGSEGFGYDPLFMVNNVSFADMTTEEKDAVSHRAVALKQLLAELPGFLGQQAVPEAMETPAVGEEAGDVAMPEEVETDVD